MIDDRWETWGIAARWDAQHGWHDPVNDIGFPEHLLKDMDDATA
ncbi:MAG TPA: hypothetical protein VHE33_20795 [Acidobacteriaceae bacterium]|nr:hypothetical protein [Acidobacteriaceae bacterium]